MKPKDSPHPVPFVDVQVALNNQATNQQQIPSAATITQWVLAALPREKAHSELSIRIVEEQEIQQLNLEYRHQNKPTNVLSFPCTLPPEVTIPLLGDLVVCASVIKKEASEQGKTETAHWAHMIIHGTLHLLGYDHIEEAEAIKMEQLETNILSALGYPAPYGKGDHE